MYLTQSEMDLKFFFSTPKSMARVENCGVVLEISIGVVLEFDRRIKQNVIIN